MRVPAELRREERAELGTVPVAPTNGQIEAAPPRSEPVLPAGVPEPLSPSDEANAAPELDAGRPSSAPPPATVHIPSSYLRAFLSTATEQLLQLWSASQLPAQELVFRLLDSLQYPRRLPRQIAKALVPRAYRAPVKDGARFGKRLCKRAIEELVERPTWATRGFAERLALRTLKTARTVKRLWDGSVVWTEPWPMDLPLVSVIIPCFNYGHFIDDALQSVYRQTLCDFEIILVEGGSTDGFTAEKIRSITHPKLTKIFQPAMTPVGENRLKGLLAARGKYAVFLDPDDILDPTYLEKAVMVLELCGVDIAYSSVQVFGRESWIWETADEFTLANLAQMNTIPTVAMFRLKTWKRLRIGYPTDREISGIEDWDFWLRFAERGVRGIKIREPLMHYRIHGNSLTDEAKKREGESKRKILTEHRSHLGPYRVERISNLQRRLPEVRQPLLNLSRLERSSEAPFRIVLALPWTIVGGSDGLMVQVFSDLKAFDASLCVYSTLETPKNMGSSAADYRKITDDFFDLPNDLPPGARNNAIVHLLRSRRINLLMIVGSAVTYELLPRLKKEVDGLRVVDHLYNAVGHFANNRRYASLIDFHIVANDEVRRALLKSGEPAAKIKVIRHGIDMARYSPTEVGWVEQGWSNLPLPARSKLILYAGRFSEEKGVLRFVDIANALRGEPGLVFAMTGDGPQRQLVESRLAELGLEKRVHMLGIVSDSRPFLRRADVVVIPSEIEGLPLVCLEALALGTPVVASRIGALPKVIDPGVNGYLAEPGHLDSFVDAIGRALSLDSNRSHLAEVCRSSVVNRFGISRVRAQYFRIFRELTAKARSKRRSRS